MDYKSKTLGIDPPNTHARLARFRPLRLKRASHWVLIVGARLQKMESEHNTPAI